MFQFAVKNVVKDDKEEEEVEVKKIVTLVN